jgi:hypothetical protein
MNDCRAALVALQDEGVEAWQGLPTGCAPDELAPAIGDVDPSPGMTDLGLRKAFFRSGILAASGAALQVWTTTDEREVLMLAIAAPSFLLTGQAAAERLGDPDARLDSARGTVPLPASEWLYAGRGLAVFVDPDTDAVWRATLFRACTPAEYEDEFRVGLLERRFPMH